jgi:hypothetical protein
MILLEIKFFFLLYLRLLSHTETKQELVRTRADFLMTTDDLSAKLNGVFLNLKLDKNPNAKIF